MGISWAWLLGLKLPSSRSAAPLSIFSLLAARTTSATGISLSGGIGITDGSDQSALLRMKVRRPRETADELRKSGYSTFILAERMYMDGQRIYGTDDLPEESAYFSILYAGK